MWCGGCLASVSFPSSKCLTSIHYRIEHHVRQCVTERKDKQTHTHTQRQTHWAKCTQIAGAPQCSCRSQSFILKVSRVRASFIAPDKGRKTWCCLQVLFWYFFFNRQINYLVRYGQVKPWVGKELERGIKRKVRGKKLKFKHMGGVNRSSNWGSMMGVSQEVM